MKSNKILILLAYFGLLALNMSCRASKELNESDFRYQLLLHDSMQVRLINTKIKSMPTFILRDFKNRYSGIDSSSTTPNNTCMWVKGWPGSQLVFWTKTEKSKYLVVYKVRGVIYLNIYSKKFLHRDLVIRVALYNKDPNEPDWLQELRRMLFEGE
jgi:hypothetical protein